MIMCLGIVVRRVYRVYSVLIPGVQQSTVVWYTVYRVYSAGSDGWLGVSLKMRKSVMMTGCDPVW